jgi:hypothetical protein
MAGDLISVRTRQAFQTAFKEFPLNHIAQEFDAEGVVRRQRHESSHTSERMRLVEQYYATVKWAHPESVGRVLRVFERLLAEIANRSRYDAVYGDPNPYVERRRRLETLLEGDGYAVVGERIEDPFAKLPTGPKLSVQIGTGFGHFVLIRPAMHARDWAKSVKTVHQLCVAQEARHTHLLEEYNFECFEATNDGSDEFCVLLATLNLDEFAACTKKMRDDMFKAFCVDLARSVQTVSGKYIRFVVFTLRTDEEIAETVIPDVQNAGAAVAEALKDVEAALAAGRPLSAVDRIHTALQGYLRAVCNDASIPLPTPDTIPALTKAILASHSAFDATAPHAEHALRALRSLGAAVDSLGSVRNHGSIAHANETLLAPAEARLVVNAANAILTYFHEKIGVRE